MKQTLNCEFLVAGAGIAGICAAVQAGRLGLDTVIIEKEMTLGGNAGPLFGVGPSGAHVNNEYYTETGIVMEIEERLSKAGARPAQNYMALNTSVLWDRVISDMLREAGVRIFRKHLVTDAKVTYSKIRSVYVTNIENLEKLEFNVNGFALDATGDAHLAYLAGADIAIGRESKSETGERSAPENPDNIISAASLMAITIDTGIIKEFIPPKGTPEWNPAKPANTFDPNKKYNYIFQVDEGGHPDGLNSMTTPQDLYESLTERIYSIWDYFKNVKFKGKADTHELIWISPILGRRESRRIIGDYLLTQTDIESNRDFKDAAGFGGFYLDYHPPSEDGGYETVFYYNPLPYQIPLRCLYSRNIKNLFSGGRAISVTHLAFTSTRVMRTGGLLGQSAAVAAYLSHIENILPSKIVNGSLNKYHKILKRNDVFIPGLSIIDEDNLVTSAKISTNNEAKISSPDILINPQCTKETVECRLYSIPQRIDSLYIFVKNTKNRTRKLTLEMSYGKTSSFDMNKPKPGSNSKNYEFHYPKRENDVTQFETIFTDSMTIPAHYSGWVSFKCNLKNLEAADRKTVRKCLRIKAMGNLDIATSNINPDFIHGNNIPAIKIEPEYIFGDSSNISDGYLHREGIGLHHMWVFNTDMENPPILTIDFNKEITFKKIEFVFDTTKPTESDMFYCKGYNRPQQLVKDYIISAESKGKKVVIKSVNDNNHRFNKIEFAEKITANKLFIKIKSVTSNVPQSGIYEVRVYEK